MIHILCLKASFAEYFGARRTANYNFCKSEKRSGGDKQHC